MPVHVERLIEVLGEICEEKNLQAAVKESLKGGLLAGCCAVLGGLLSGPPGLAVGGAVGGLLASVKANGKFKPVVNILINMPHDKKQCLCNKILAAFRDFGPQDFLELAILISSSSNFKELAIREVKDFLMSNMNLSIRS